MPVRPQEHARIDLERHVPEIVDVVNAARDRYLREGAPMLHSLVGRTKCSLMRDLVVDGMRRWANGARGVQYFRAGNLEWFGFDNDWIVRVKHVDHGFSADVSPTVASDLYDRNVVPASIATTLHTDADPTTLYLGLWEPDVAPDELHVALVCPDVGDVPAWVWPLIGDGLPDVLPLPLPAPVEPTAPAVRVRLRRPARDEDVG